MVRPRIKRFCRCRPCSYYYKPRGIPMRHLDEVVLACDELEALKLHDVDGLDHTLSAKRMKISQPTFGRILDAAYKKIADAIVNGKAVRIENA